MTERATTRQDALDLIAGLRANESGAWEAFLRDYRRLIFSAIHAVNRRYNAAWDESTMEEIFSDAAYKLMKDGGRALKVWGGRCRFETWIYRIVRNVCIDHLRKSSRRSAHEQADDDAIARAPGPTGSAARRDLRMSLEQAMEKALEPREALAVRLIYFEGFTYKEVAERLGTSVGAMSGLVYRAMAKLRRDGGVTREWETRS